MNVYRVENENCVGPYVWYLTQISYWTEIVSNEKFTQIWKYLDNHQFSNAHPGGAIPGKPLYDLIDTDINFKDYKFGFESIEKLNSWFSSKELKLLKFFDFNIVVYKDVEKFRKSNKQVAFIPTTCKEILSNSLLISCQ